jgi:serine/threonine protein kinase
MTPELRMAATLTPLAEPIPGYRLIERIGRGGFGEVWKCEAPGGFFKAIKLVYGNLDDAGDEGKGAEQERKSLERIKQIRHPFLLSLERYDIIDGQLRIVMELADRSLWDRFRESRTQSLPGIPREELLRYLAEAAEALDLMNVEYNLQHLDVKPQNLFLVHNHVKVADFGLVKLFEGSSASVTGGVTPVYAAPETFDGRATRFSDQYSLAIVYQELLVGVRPFNGTNTRQLVLQHLTHAPNLAPLPESDRGPVGRALAKSELDRFPTCAAFIAALQANTGESGDQVSTPAPSARATPLPSNDEAQRRSRVPLPSQLISRPATGDPSMTQSLGPAMATMQRPVDVAVSAMPAKLPADPPEQTGPGALAPVVVIGVGAVGDRVVRYLRRAVCDQFGGTDATPHLRLLTVDTDPETAAGSRDVILTRLHRPSHYLAKARDGGALDWLPPGLLYRLPRNPCTTGLRGLGRLAFWDHAKAIETRLKAELEAALNPAALSEADRRTGLGLRTNRPRVYIVANSAGGTGGGMFVDLGYLARHVLRKLGYSQPDVVGVLLLPPADKSGSRPVALANTYATLTELAHFSRTDTTYEAKFGPRDAAVLDPVRPFGRCLCLPLPLGSDAAARRHAAGAAAGVMFREMLAPLGRAADAGRPASTAAAFCHTAATYRLSWPGRRLARRAGRLLAARLLRQWTVKDLDPVRLAVTAWLDEQWESRQLAPEQLIDRLTAAAEAAVGGPPDARFDALVAAVDERTPGRTPLDGRSACLLLNDLAELAGKPHYGGDDPPPGELQKAIAAAAFDLTAEYDQKLAELAVHFIELPCHRLAGAEEAVRQLTDRLRRAVETYDALAQSLTKEATELYAKLFPLIGTLDTVSAGKRATLAVEIVELLRTFPKKRYQALLAGQVLTTYRNMVSAAPEYLREVSFCRNRLNEAASLLEQDSGDGGGPSPFGPGRDLFSGGRRGLNEAAADLIAGLSADDLLELDNRVQMQVRTQFRSVIAFCLESTGSPVPLSDLVREQAERFLANRSGGDSAASAVFAHFAADPQAAHRAAAEAYDEAGPTLAEKAGTEIGLLAAPAGPAGDEFRRITAEAVPGEELEPADSPDEIVFYRERAGLALTDLPQFGPVAKAAYEAERDGEHAPHSRGDVAWKGPPGR